MQSYFYTLFPNCIIVKGKVRATICDIQRNRVELIPIELAEFMEKYRSFSEGDISDNFDSKDMETVWNFVNSLRNNNYIYTSNNRIKNFPKFDTNFKSFSSISNIIVETDSKSDLKIATNLRNIINQLQCISLEIRIYDYVDENYIKNFISYFKESNLRSIYLLLKYSDFMNNDYFYSLFKDNLRLMNIIVHSSPNESIDIIFLDRNIIKTKLEIVNHSFCGNIDSKYFSCNVDLFSESKNYNNCLNKKLSIDVNGNIRNCPSLPIIFGNILNDDIQSIIEKTSFQKLWFIKKDEISICKDCEFRYICTDCRAFIKDNDDIYSKPEKCNYNPYEGIWE